MIGAVSFAGTQESSFQDLVNKQQFYQNTQPNAASEVGDSYDGKSKKGEKVKTLGKVLLGAVLVAGALVAGSKTGISNKIPKVGKYLDNAGRVIAEKSTAAFRVVKDKIKGLGKKGAETAESAADDVVAAAGAKTETTAAKTGEAVKGVADDAVAAAGAGAAVDAKEAAEVMEEAVKNI